MLSKFLELLVWQYRVYDCSYEYVHVHVMGREKILEIELKSEILNFDPFVKNFINLNKFLLDGTNNKNLNIEPWCLCMKFKIVR